MLLTPPPIIASKFSSLLSIHLTSYLQNLKCFLLCISVLRYVPLESLDPSLALGFYCRDKADFDDLCHRASTLAEESKGAPLFTVTQTHSLVNHHSSCEFVEDREEEHGEEDDWQLL